MAGNRVVIKFIGDDASLKKSLDALGAKTKTLNDRFGRTGAALGKVVKPLALLGAAGSAIKFINGATAALGQLLPIALLLPAALLAGGAAMATFKIATAGFADALGGDAKALAKLAPSARATAVAVRALAPAFDKVKSATQQAFFRNFATDVKTLGKDYLPMLAKRLPEIAAGFNTMGRSVARALTVPDSRAAVDSVLSNTSGLLSKMPNALGHVVTGFLALGGAGSKYLPAIGRFIDGLTDKFRYWALQLTESGRFDQLVGAAKAGFGDLFKIIGNVGSVLGSLWKGLSGGSGASSPLATLRDMTGALRTFFSSAAAQGPLQALGATMAALSTVVRDVLMAALKAIAPILEKLAPVATELGQQIGRVLVTAVEQLGPPLLKLIDRLLPIVAKVLPALGDILINVVIPALVGLVNGITWVIDAVQKFAEMTVASFLQAAHVVLGWASSTLGALQTVFGVLSHLPGAFGVSMGQAAAATGNAKRSVDDLRGTVDQLQSKSVNVIAQTQGLHAVQDLLDTIGLIPTIKQVTVQARTSVIGSLLSPLGLGHRALGGPVQAGRSYVVGENGPEVVTMGGGGSVTPNGGGGGGRTVTFAGNTSDALATVIMQLVREKKIIFS